MFDRGEGRRIGIGQRRTNHDDEGARARRIHVAGREPAAHRQPLRRLLRDHMAHPAALPRCSGANFSELLLPRRGTLVAWTTQGFVPI